MKKLALIITLLIGICIHTHAQDTYAPTRVTSNDIRGRVEGTFEWEHKDLSLEAGVQLRMNNNLGTIDRVHSTIGIDYKTCKYFNIGLDYILINLYEPTVQSWERPRHRINLNLVGNVKVGNVELSLRERLQTTFRTDSINRYEKANPELILRSRIMAEYDIRHSKWSPYILFELNNTLNAPAVVANYKSAALHSDNYITRYRLGIGTKFRVTRNHRLDFYYYFDFNRDYDIDYKSNAGSLKGYTEESEFRHIIGISYKFKL